jgi:N6-L-threonylcarbamoyladenine synthase
VSGGHCQLLAVEGVGRFNLYGTTIDDAAGEAFDKTAKLMGLPYPGGPRVEALARDGNPKRYPLPRPMLGRDSADFSFSGLKTAVRQIVQEGDYKENDAADLAASFQAAVIDSLIDRVRHAMRRFRGEFQDAKSFVIAGGVAANKAIGDALKKLASDEGLQTKIPPPGLCTDNAAMVAWTGVERCQLALFDSLGAEPRARWPLHGAAVGGRPHL